MTYAVTPSFSWHLTLTLACRYLHICTPLFQLYTYWERQTSSIPLPIHEITVSSDIDQLSSHQIMPYRWRPMRCTASAAEWHQLTYAHQYQTKHMSQISVSWSQDCVAPPLSWLAALRFTNLNVASQLNGGAAQSWDQEILICLPIL